jgi:hypothetical protein
MDLQTPDSHLRQTSQHSQYRKSLMWKGGQVWNLGGHRLFISKCCRIKLFYLPQSKKKKNQIHCFCCRLNHCGFFRPTSHVNSLVRLSLEAQV